MEKADVRKMEYNNLEDGINLMLPKVRVFKEKLYGMPLLILGMIYTCVIILPVAAILKKAGFIKIFHSINDPDNIFALKLSFLTTFITVAIVFLLCTPLVLFIGTGRDNTICRFLEVIFSLPAVLPPSVAGLGLLLAFGSNGFLGILLKSMGLDVVFTPLAVVIAQLFVSSGFYIQVMLTGVRAIGTELFEVSYTLGAGKIETFLYVIMPMLKKTVLAGLLLSWVRAMGEFGATIVFAGNVMGRTQTLPLRVYSLIQTDITLAAAVSSLSLAISFVLLTAVKLWISRCSVN